MMTKSQRLVDCLTLAIILINTVLMLAGVLALRYDLTRQGQDRWSPAAPPAFEDPHTPHPAALT